MQLRVRPQVTSLSAIRTARSEAGSPAGSASRQHVVMTGAVVLVGRAGGGVLGRLEDGAFRWRPAAAPRFGFSLTRTSVLKRFSDRRTIEHLSPRLRDAARSYRFTLRYSF
jgi:hypothetical protein